MSRRFAATAGIVTAVARFGRANRSADGVPVLRRADAHPDAPARRPIRAAADLGEPLPIVAAPVTAPLSAPERPLPADLDQPLAAFDPDAMPAAPREPVRAVAALAPRAPETAAPRPTPIDPGERFETFALTPAVRAAGPIAAPEAMPPTKAPLATASIASLLERLEQASPRRVAPPAPVNLDETLGMLRRLAAG